MMAGAGRQICQQIFYLTRLSRAAASCCAPPALTAAAAATAAAGNTRGIALSSRHWHRWRGFHSNAASVQQLLDGVTATQLREALADEAQTRPFMTQQELLHFIIKQQAADNEAEAEARAEVLSKAGLVLRFNGMVYLRPEEVSEMVYRLLPTDPQAAERHLAAVEQELAHMDEQHKQINLHAKRWPRRWLVLGCTALATQLFGFMYLTWWELSWDVMEPVAYFVSLGYSLIAYMYFLYTRGSYFEQKDFKEYWEQQLLEKRMTAAGFDLDKYTQLRRTRDRYRRYLATHPQQHDGAAAEADAEAATIGKLKDS